jgi:hypothetical protein
VVLPVREVWCCLRGECGAAREESVVLPVRDCGIACGPLLLI